MYFSGIGNVSFFWHIKLNSGFNVMTVDEISPYRPEIFSNCRFIFLVCRLRLFHFAMRVSPETLSLRFAPTSEWEVPGIRSLFLTILPNHLPQEIQILHFFELSGLLSHSVFQDIFLMRPKFPTLQYQQSECLLSKFLPRSLHTPEKSS